MLPLLLLAQVFAGMSPGSVLCIATGEGCCGPGSTHAAAAHPHASACDGHGHAHHPGHRQDARDHIAAHRDAGSTHGDTAAHRRDTAAHRHDTGATHPELAAGDGCGCHFHVALPGDAGGPRVRGTHRIDDLRLLPPAICAPALHLDAAWIPTTRAAAPCAMRWLDAWHASDQCRARAVTRLLI